VLLKIDYPSVAAYVLRTIRVFTGDGPFPPSYIDGWLVGWLVVVLLASRVALTCEAQSFLDWCKKISIEKRWLVGREREIQERHSYRANEKKNREI
jgi:hypothetical protein